ncbi:hypothetical protein [Devosia sp. BK]|nr:hypothetical protein [Devosia sp. BK]
MRLLGGRSLSNLEIGVLVASLIATLVIAYVLTRGGAADRGADRTHT